MFRVCVASRVLRSPLTRFWKGVHMAQFMTGMWCGAVVVVIALVLLMGGDR